MRRETTIDRRTCNGEDLRDMFAAATRALERRAPTINALNVFPVPDGDTGTNMLLTMRATMAEADAAPNTDACVVAQAMAHGSLMGARGNSGVILSQILRGIAKGLCDKAVFDGEDLANAFREAAELAYRGVSQPAEGTMLTVMREAAAAAEEAAQTLSLPDVLGITAAAARESVARTPMLLPVLKEAGVVDAGGLGLYTLLDTAWRHLTGQTEDGGSDADFDRQWLVTPIFGPTVVAEPVYGYCTEFVVSAERLDVEALRNRLRAIDPAAMVVGDESTAHVHLHTFDPGAAISCGTSVGSLSKVKVDNMQAQHEEWLARHEAGVEPQELAIVAVVSGHGLTRVFQSLGPVVIVPGGQTMNPSVAEILAAIERAPSDKVIILPNNENIVMTAHEAAAASAKQVAVISSRSIPQGISALIALKPGVSLEENAPTMQAMAGTVQTGEITSAIRAGRSGEIAFEAGQSIGILDGELVAAADRRSDVFRQLLELMQAQEKSLLSIYWGADADPTETERMFSYVKQRYPSLEVEVVEGGQPHYPYIISIE